MSYTIVDVLKDAVSGNLEFVDDTIAKQRAAICDGCDIRLSRICTACGCFIDAKVKLTKSECPLDKWSN